MTIGDVLSEEEMNVFYNQIIGDKAFNQETLLNVLLGYKWRFWVAIKFMQGENGKIPANLKEFFQNFWSFKNYLICMMA